MSNKLHYFFSFILFLFLIILPQYGKVPAQQLTAKLIPPPTNQLKSSELWKVELINPNRNEFKITVSVDLKEKASGIQATSSTKLINIVPGSKRFSFTDFNFAGINYRNPKLQEAFGKNLTAPDGNYTMCVYVKNEKGVEIARDCIELSIVSPKLEKVNPQLISPANKSELDVKRPVVFTWMLPSVKPATDITYKLKVVEIMGNQTAQEAINKNPAWFEKDGIRGTTFNYPASAQKLSSGKIYAWKVSTGEGRSEIYTFMISSCANLEITPSVVCGSTGNNIYNYTLTCSNTGSTCTQQVNSVALQIAGIPITVNSPTSFPFLIAPGQTSTITGQIGPVTPQTIIFNIAVIGQNSTTYHRPPVQLPSCTCCGDLVKRVRPIYNGGDVMTVSLQAYPKKIKKITAQLVYVNSTTQDGCPVCKDNYRNWGNFGGNHSNSINGLQLTSQLNRELIWGSDNTEPKDFSTPFSINVGMKLDEILASNFPEVLKPCCKTKVDYCIRYSFTTEDCITCDTLICSTVESGVPVAKKQAQIENENGIKSLPQNGKKQSNNRSSFPGIIFFPLLGINYKRIRDYLRTLFDCRFTFLLITLSMLYATVNYAQTQSCTPQVEIGYQKLECFNEVRAQNHAEGKDQFQHVAVCMNQQYTYSALGSGWVSYNWSVTGPSTISNLPNAEFINITWPQAGEYTLTLVATDGQNNTSTRIIKIDVKEKPHADFTFTPNTGCTGTSILFTNTTTATGSVAYYWDFGDGHLSDQENPNHTYTEDSTYEVTLVAYNFEEVYDKELSRDTTFRSCCADTFKQSITINNGNIQICVSTVCAGEKVTYTAEGCSNVTWLPPTGSSEYQTNGNKITIVWRDGAVQGVINAQCSGGCIASVSVPILPEHPNPMGNQNPCIGSTTSYTLPLLPGTFYEWHLNDGMFDGHLSTHPDNNTVWIDWSALPPGTYQLKVKLENKHTCCSSDSTILINLKGQFKAATDQTICSGTSPNPLKVTLINGASIPSNIDASFQWEVVLENGNPPFGVTPVQGQGTTFQPTFNNPGVYIVKVTETNQAFCNTIQQIKITVVKNPSINNVSINGPDKVCPGPYSHYTYTMSGEAPTGYYYSWSIVSGDGVFLPGTLQTFTGNSATIKWNLFPPPFPGKIKVVLKSYSLPDCPNGFIEKVITEATLGSITGATSVCADDIRTYSVNVPAGEVITWSITQAESGSIIAGQGTNSITVQWHGSSSSSSTLIATGCGTTPPLTINVCRPTEGTITQHGTDFCAGISLEAGQGTNYQWFLNGSEIQSTNNIQSISITQPGNYSVKYDIACGCKATKTIVVTNPSLCQLLITTPGPTEYCLNSTTPIHTPFIATVCSGYIYKWYKNGDEISGAIGPNYTATAAGTYYAKATKGNCIETSNSITISQIVCDPCGTCVPYAGSHNISQGSTCNNFNFSTTVYPSVKWYFGDGHIGSGTPTTHVYQSTGYFPVKIVVPCQNNDQCKQVFEENVFVPLAPDFSSLVNCSSVQFTDLTQMYAGGTITQTSWDFGDGSTSTQVSPTHNYSQPGNYQVKLTVTYSGNGVTCTSSIIHQVVVTAPAQPTINYQSPVCAGTPLAFSTNNSSSIMSYNWIFDESSSPSYSYADQVQHTFLNTGTHTVKLIVTDYNGCSAERSTIFTVKPGISNCIVNPAVAFICSGGSATLTAPQGNGYTYQWQRLDGSDFVNENSINNTLTVTTPGWYGVIITNTEGCQCISEKVEVKANPKPIASLSVSPSTRICGSGNVTISNISKVEGDKYAWYANGTQLSFSETNSSIPYSVTTNTTFTLIITNQFGCKDTCEITVYSNLPPSQPNINPTSACEGEETTFIVTPYTGNITWNTGATGDRITVSTAGTYTATYTDPTTGCTSSNSVVIHAKPPVGLFPSGCDSATCLCTVPFTIYAPKPLMGYPQSRYIITWYSATNPNPIGTGATFSPAQTGSYYIIIKDLFTDCESKSETYFIAVPQCDPTINTGCCDNLNIRITSNKIIQNNNGVVLTGQVSAGPAKIRAVAISIADFTVSYNDGDVSNTYCSTCAPNSSNWGNFAAGTAQLIPGLNPGPIFTKPASAQKLLGSREIIWGSQIGQAINLTNANINVGLLLPPSPTSECCKVTYNICVRYKFTDENCLTCDTLICYSFVPSQPTLSICDCGRWGKIKITSKGGKTVEKDCGDVPIEINDLNPGVPLTFTPNYLCNPNSSDCRVTYKYSIQKDLKPVFLPFAGSFNYTPDKIGLYKICIQAFCNDKLCGTCCVDLYVGHQKSPPKE